MTILAFVLLGVHVLIGMTANEVFTITVNGQVVHEAVESDSSAILWYQIADAPSPPDTVCVFLAGAPPTMESNGCEVEAR